MTGARAFTLLELLVATALSAILMVGVLAVVADLGAAAVAAQEKADPAAPLGPQALEAWVRLLREDLRHARTVVADKEGELVLVGYGALDAARQRTHRPVRVLYRIEEVRGRPWVTRRQAALDCLTNQNVQRDLVCGGVTRFELEGADYAFEGGPQGAQGQPPGPAAATTLQGGSGPGAASNRNSELGSRNSELAWGARSGAGRCAFGVPRSAFRVPRSGGRAYVGHRWFVLDTAGAHTRLPPEERALINSRWYISEEAMESGAAAAAVQQAAAQQPAASPISQTTGSDPDQGHQAADTVWRLRVWTAGAPLQGAGGARPRTSGQGEPAYDRVLTVPSSGCL
jgi:prepilin-type N-terminal cleavage/methylation domain-containing protein